jgi:hypothetical protein
VSAGEATYTCPRNDDTWFRTGTFALPLVVTAGDDACCLGEGKAIATVKVTDRPAVTVVPLSSPIVICDDLKDGLVDVVFEVVTDSPSLISVTSNITTGDLVCEVQGNFVERKSW